MSALSDLREEALIRADYRCEWVGCHSADDLQLAHLEHRGRGGGDKRNTMEDTSILCRTHHDILDGRTVAGRRYEVSVLLAAWLAVKDNSQRRSEVRRRQ